MPFPTYSFLIPDERFPTLWQSRVNLRMGQGTSTHSEECGTGFGSIAVNLRYFGLAAGNLEFG